MNFDDGKRFLKRWELVCEVVGCGGGVGGGGGNLVPGDLQVWSAEKYSQKMGVFFGALSATARLVFGVFPSVFRAFSSTLPIMSDLFVCGSRGPKSVPVLHHFTLLLASPDLGAQRVPGMPGMPGMQGLVLEVLVVVGDAGDVAGKMLPFFGSIFWSTFCHRKAGVQVPGRRHVVCKYGRWSGLLLVCDSVQEGCAVVGLL